jgi:RNA-directed DNA polymerase
MRALRGSNAAAVLAALTPIIRGWAAYYRSVVSSRTFKSLDDYLWKLTYKWATHGHANKSRTWVVTRYFGKFNKFRNDHWVFGDAASGAYLVKFAWTPIVRHTLVKGGASPDDPALTEYWATRRRRIKPPTGRLHVAPAHQAGRPLPPVRGRTALRRATTTVTPGMGTLVAAGHPSGDSR